MRSLSADRERGSASLEAVIVLPVLLMFVALIIGAGRVQMAHQDVDGAAAEAARAASLARNAGEAQTKGTASGQLALANQDRVCSPATISIDTSGFSTPPGTHAKVSATVVCVVDLGDVVFPGLPGSITITSHAESVLDIFRER